MASPHDGEIVATARAIGRTLKASGLDWHDLAKAAGTLRCIREASSLPAPDSASHWADVARWCRDHDGGRLTPRERDFVSNVISLCQWRDPTARQAAWLADIADRLQHAGAGNA